MRTWLKALIFACWFGGGIIGSMLLANTVAPLPSSPEEWTPAIVNENFMAFMLTAGLFACMTPFMLFVLFKDRKGKTKRKKKSKLVPFTIPIVSLTVSVAGIIALLATQAIIQAEPALPNLGVSLSAIFSVGCLLLIIMACLSTGQLLCTIRERRRANHE